MDREAINQRLHELWMQTADPTILQYIQSGWTTPVSPAVQQQVGLIVGHPVPSTGPPAGPPAQQPLPGPAPSPSSYQATRIPSSAGTSIDAPQSVALPDAPQGLPTTGFGGGSGGYMNNQPGVNQATGYGYEGPPTNIGQGLGGLFSGDPGLTNPAPTVLYGGSPPGYAGAVNGGVQNARNRVQQAVSAGRNPASGGSTVNPLPGGSAIQNAGYAQAMEGNQNALAAVMQKLMSAYGIDITRPGAYTGSLVKSLAPYLQTFMEYAGMNGEGAPVKDNARAIADQFGAMIGSGGTFGQIQNAAQGMLGTAGDILGNARGELAKPENQVNMINDLMGMLLAGDNNIYQQSALGGLQGSVLDYYTGALDDPTSRLLPFLRQQAGTGRLPGGDLLAQILGGATTGR